MTTADRASAMVLGVSVLALAACATPFEQGRVALRDHWEGGNYEVHLRSFRARPRQQQEVSRP